MRLRPLASPSLRLLPFCETTPSFASGLNSYTPKAYHLSPPPQQIAPLGDRLSVTVLCRSTSTFTGRAKELQSCLVVATAPGLGIKVLPYFPQPDVYGDKPYTKVVARDYLHVNLRTQVYR